MYWDSIEGDNVQVVRELCELIKFYSWVWETEGEERRESKKKKEREGGITLIYHSKDPINYHIPFQLGPKVMRVHIIQVGFP